MEAPRVNASMLTQYSGKTVCLVGNVTEISSNGAELKLMACDHKVVKVTLDVPLDEKLQGAVEVIGRVENNCSLSGHRIIPYSNDFDLDAYSQAVSLAADFPEIFGSTQLNGFGH
ncbi:replication protein A 14 kDa subunit [Pocillopora verrucosa]|uniref:Replication protein A 14 kDa subunit n=2 Tax=Pocillopora TaxID=46730 RepID=A0A3M6UDS6_POCDA|nr:replication protein A 14 kDa subunit-like [Pocillopora damicornis]XP_058964528.1 replication protein A 14 kDa subunit-like [Pocillopora verrucosa]RMX51785.1 hypothetical protein pdam_00011658 [Pocillopora damicornis]CAH3147699.1 unnamed protein product [Pocillopora meandrina]